MWKILKKRAEPVKENVEDNIDDNLLRALLSGEKIGKEEAMNIPTFSSCVNKIAETVSTIPFKLYKRKDDTVEEIKEDIRVKLLNQDTKDTLSGVEFKRAMIKDYLTGKGGYAYIHRAGNKIKSLHYVKEEEISFIFTPDPIFKDYNIVIQGTKYNPMEFLKILRNTDNGRNGTSIIEECKQLLKVCYTSLKFEEYLLLSGGNKKGFITSENTLTESSMQKLKAAWRNLYQNNSENVVILNKGLNFKESSSTSVELQLNENKKTNSDEICKIFQMPPAMINGRASEQDKADYIQYCLNGILEEMACSMNRDLLLEKEKGSYFFAADTSELTKGDIKKRYGAYATAIKNGFLQIDEIRFKENMPPLGLDFVKLGLQDVLYDPATKECYVPNMNTKGSLKKGGSDEN